MREAGSDVELTSLVNADHRSDCEGSGDCRAGDAPPLPAADKKFCPKKATRVLFLSFLSGTMAMASMLVLTLQTKEEPSVATGRNRTGDASSSVDAAWSSLRWSPLDVADNCYPGFRLANATLHCGIGTPSPLPVPLATDLDGRRYCGGVELEPNSCTLPSEGTWKLPSRENASAPVPPLHGRFGVTSTNSTLPRCKTMEQVIDGGLKEGGEWVSNTCSVVPLSPFVWTEKAQCQITITMMVSRLKRETFSARIHFRSKLQHHLN